MVKDTQTIRQQRQTNFLSVFDHFVGLALKVITLTTKLMYPFYFVLFGLSLVLTTKNQSHTVWLAFFSRHYLPFWDSTLVTEWKDTFWWTLLLFQLLSAFVQGLWLVKLLDMGSHIVRPVAEKVNDIFNDRNQTLRLISSEYRIYNI